MEHKKTKKEYLVILERKKYSRSGEGNTEDKKPKKVSEEENEQRF